MLDRGDAVELIEDLQGDEHDWIDMKEDYYVIGLDNKKAEFIKDIVSMANTSSDRSEHYILVGVDDDDGDLVGVSHDFDDNSDPQHILNVDESDLQQVLAEYLSPSPNVTLYKFVDESPKFGVLAINPIKRKPCMIQKSIDFHGDRKLQEGLIYFRNGSSNTIALHADLERIIDERVQNRREEILEGIRTATEIGPEAVASVGELVHDDGEGDVVVEVGEEGDFVMEERFSREPVSDLDERLTLDIKRWATTDTVTIDAGTLWEYYSSAQKLSIDQQSVLFLTQAALEKDAYGAYWLTYTDLKSIQDILSSAASGFHRNKSIARILSIVGDCEGLQNFYDEINDSTKMSPFPRFLDCCDAPINDRLEILLSNIGYVLSYEDWNGEFDLIEMEIDELRDMIRTLATHLQELETRYSGHDLYWSRRQDFSEALADTEITLLARTVE